jgi:hypothetical protein
MPRVPDLASALPAKSTMKLSQEIASPTNTESICSYRLGRWQRSESKPAAFQNGPRDAIASRAEDSAVMRDW